MVPRGAALAAASLWLTGLAIRPLETIPVRSGACRDRRVDSPRCPLRALKLRGRALTGPKLKVRSDPVLRPKRHPFPLSSEGMILSFEGFEIDDRLYELRHGDRPVHIEPRAFDLLLHLIRNRDRVVPKHELLTGVWNGISVADSAISTCINTLRRALGLRKDADQIIETVRGRGYRFSPPVEERHEPGDKPVGSDRAPGPAPTTSDFFIGRGDALELLGGRLGEVCDGRARIVLVRGEPGIGKTRTIDHFLETIEPERVLACATRCPESEGTPAYWPWVNVVSTLVSGLDAARLREALGSISFELGALLPEIAELLQSPRPDHSGREPERVRLFDAVSRLLRFRADSMPVVLVLDDLQWADEASLELLAHLARELRHERVLVVATLRDHGTAVRRGLAHTLAELVRLDACTSYVLEGFSEADLAEYVAQQVQVDPPLSFVRGLLDRTGGNPLFVREVVGLLVREGVIGWAQVSGQSLDVVPPALQELILRRLELLSPRTLSLLKLAAVIGREFSLPILAGAADLSRSEILAAIDEAGESGLVNGSPTQVAHYRFFHAIVRDGIYDGLAASERAQLHERVALSLENRGGEGSGAFLSELAHHWFGAAARGHEQKALDYMIRCARGAFERLAYEEAATLYERALALLDSTRPDAEQLRLELLLALGESQSVLGDGEHARSTLREAAELAKRRGDMEAFGNAVLAFSGSTFWGWSPDLGESNFLEEAESLFKQIPSTLHAQLANKAVMSRWGAMRSSGTDLHPLVPEAEEALSLARRRGDSGTLCEALHNLHMILQGPDYLEERSAIASELLEMELGANGFAIREAIASDHLIRGDFDGYREGLKDAIACGRNSPYPSFRWLASINEAGAALIEGRFLEAEQGIAESAELGRIARHSLVVPATLGLTTTLKLAREGFAGFADFVEEQANLAASMDWVGVYPRVLFARLMSEIGRTDEALALLNSLVGSSAPAIARNNEWLMIYAELAALCDKLDAVDYAEPLYRELTPFDGCMAVYQAVLLFAGPVAFALGLLARTGGEVSRAEAHFEDAFEQCEALGARPFAARVLCEQGKLLIGAESAAQRERGATLLSEAERRATELGMKTLAETAVRLRET